MKKFNSILVLLLILVTSCAESNEWLGTYSYEAELGKNVAENSIIVEYTLTISSSKCALSIVGYQVNENLICSANTRGNDLAILFKSYENGSTKNIYDVAVYNTSEPLFVLSKEKAGVITHWRQLNPDESKSKSGEYLVKE